MKGQLGGAKRYCPVCRQYIIPTTNNNICRHRDTLGHNTCPMSGEPYHLAEIGHRPHRRKKHAA